MIAPPHHRAKTTAKHASTARREDGLHFASALLDEYLLHHLATFRSYSELQLEMGHRSAELLRTRYVAMSPGCDAFLAS